MSDWYIIKAYHGCRSYCCGKISITYHWLQQIRLCPISLKGPAYENTPWSNLYAIDFKLHFLVLFRDESKFPPNQWETALLFNGVSHWLGAILESALLLLFQYASTTEDEKKLFDRLIQGGVYIVPGFALHCPKSGWARFTITTHMEYLQIGNDLTATMLDNTHIHTQTHTNVRWEYDTATTLDKIMHR